MVIDLFNNWIKLQRDVEDMYITEKKYRKVDTAVNFGGKKYFLKKADK